MLKNSQGRRGFQEAFAANKSEIALRIFKLEVLNTTFIFLLILLLPLLQMHFLVSHEELQVSECGASLSAPGQRRWEGQLSHRLDKLELFFLLDLLDFEDILQRGVVEELPLLINLCVSLRMSKHDGEDEVAVGVNAQEKSEGSQVVG